MNFIHFFFFLRINSFQVGYSSMPNRPYSSMSGGYGGGHDPLAHDPLGLDNSQSYLGVDGGGGMGMGSVLRDTAISGYENDDSNRARFLASHRFVGVIRCLVVCCLHFSPHRRTNECKTDQSASIILCYFISTMCFHQLNRFHIFDKSWLGLELNY